MFKFSSLLLAASIVTSLNLHAAEEWIHFPDPTKIACDDNYAHGTFRVYVVGKDNKKELIFSDRFTGAKQEELMRQCRAAIYQAKLDGKGCYMRISDGLVSPDQGFFIRQSQ
nr:hypothetical protein HAGR004_19580 [Bdellovibrio sp. HAGR004]